MNTLCKTLPSVGVVIVSWNNKADVIECLESLTNVDYDCPHIVLVDNASSDDVVEAMMRQYPQVYIIRNMQNLGFVGGNNLGIQYCLRQAVEYILLLNSDTVVPKDMLRKLVALSETDSQIGMVNPVIVSYLEHSDRYIPEIDWKRYAAGERQFHLHSAPIKNVLDYATGCALLVKASVVNKIGLLDPEFFAYYEDVDWSLRCQNAGYRTELMADADIWHKGTPNNGVERKSETRWYYYIRNQALFIRKHGNWRRWFILLADYTRYCFDANLSAIQVGERTRANTILDGWWAGLTNRFGARRIAAPQLIRTQLPRFWLLVTQPKYTLRQAFPVRSVLRKAWKLLSR